MSAKRKRLPDETLRQVRARCAADAHVYLPSPIVAELLRGYQRYVALTGDPGPTVVDAARAAEGPQETRAGQRAINASLYVSLSHAREQVASVVKRREPAPSPSLSLRMPDQ